MFCISDLEATSELAHAVVNIQLEVSISKGKKWKSKLCVAEGIQCVKGKDSEGKK